MALDLQSPNFSGTAAIAGRGISNLGLESAGALGLQAVQMLKQEEAAKRQAALEQMRIGQEGGLALAQQGIARQGLLQQQDQFDREQARQQAVMAQQGSQFQDDMNFKRTGLDQVDAQKKAELDLEKQKFMMVKQQQEMAKLVDEKAEKLHEKGAFASYGLLAMNQAKTPEEAQALRMEILKEAKDKGFVDDAEYKNASKASISMFKNMLGYKVMQTGMAKEYQDMLPKPVKGQQAGSSIQFDSNGNIASINVAPTLANTTKAEETLNDRSQALLKLGEMQKNFNPEYFTKLSQAKNWVSKQAEVNKGIPAVGTGFDKAAEYLTGKKAEERSADIQKFTDYMNSVEQFFNQTYKQPMTGAAVGEDELKKLRAGYLSGDMSASEAKGALDQLVRKYVGEVEFNKNFLRKGADISPGNTSALREHFRKEGFSEEKINQFIKSKGLE